jgi:glutamate dehydrogenase/leucine dehydrogenase
MELSQLLPPQTLDSDPVLEFEADLEEAARAIDLEAWVLQRLKHTEREITLNIPLVRDDGSVVNVTGYRLQHSRVHGPCIGPVILSPAAHTSTLRITAAEITLQSAMLSLRLGGASGALVVNPDQLSERELRHVIKDFVLGLHENTGPLRDVVACDGNEYIARWMDEANTHAHGQSEPAAVVGNTDRDSLDSAWARTLTSLIQHALDAASLAGMRIALQGFGRRARVLAGCLDAQGAKLVAIADRSGGLLREDGIDVTALHEHVKRDGVAFGFASAEPASNCDVLECECDGLILAAAQKQLGAHNAGSIRAKVVFELTQGALTQTGEAALPQSCLFVPDLICGAAQLAIWSHEWQRGLSYSAPDPQQAEADATELVLDAFDRARRMASDQGVSLRHAALMLSLSRLASTLRIR